MITRLLKLGRAVMLVGFGTVLMYPELLRAVTGHDHYEAAQYTIAAVTVLCLIFGPTGED